MNKKPSPGTGLLILPIVLSFLQLSAQTVKTNKAPVSTGDWSLVLEKSYFDGLISRNGELYGYTTNSSGKTPELFRIKNNNAELVLGEQDIDAKGDYFKTYIDNKSGIYILYHQKGEMEQVRKWNGDRMEAFSDNMGQSLHLWNLYIDPLNQVIGECREKMVSEFGPLMIIKKGAWTSAGLQKVKGFTDPGSRKQYKSDAAGNLYAFTSNAIARWNGTTWSEVAFTDISGTIQGLLLNEDGVLHVLLNGENGAKIGKIYKQGKTGWTEIKTDAGFFDQMDVYYVRFEIAGKDQLFAQVQLKNKNASNNDYPLYWWNNNGWVSMLENRSNITADNNSFWVYGFGKNLYMNNYKSRYVLKWEPSAGAPVAATAAKPVNPTQLASSSQPVKPAPVKVKSEPVKTTEPKVVETQIKQVGDYYIFRSNGKYGVQEGYLRTVNKLEANYDTITGLQIKEGNKMKALFVVLDKSGIQVFDPVTMKLFRTATKIVEYWHYEGGLWLKTAAGRWNLYPEPINSSSGVEKIQFINNSLIIYPTPDKVQVASWKSFQTGTTPVYSIPAGAEIVDFGQTGQFSYKRNNKFGYSDWESLLFLPEVFTEMKMWSVGTTVYLQFRYDGDLYQTTTSDLRRAGTATYANIKAFQYSANCGRSGCKNGVIGYSTNTSGGEVERRTYKKLTINGWIEITETSVTPVLKTKEAIRCNDPAHDYKSFMMLPTESGYEVHRMK